MVGDRMMIAPLFAGEPSRQVVIPAGAGWHDFWTGAAVAGGSVAHVDASTRNIAVYVKAGSVVPWADVGQHAGSAESRKLTIRVYGDGSLPFEMRNGNSTLRLRWAGGQGTADGAGEYNISSWKKWSKSPSRKQLPRRKMLMQGSALSVAVPLPGIAKPTVAAATPVSRLRRWIHPGIFQRQQDLEFMRAQVAAGRDPWKAAWDRMLSLPTSSLDFTPQPVTHIVRGSYGAGQKGDREINASIESAESHVLQWFVTGKEVHAQKAASIIGAWSSVIGDFSGNDAMLLGGWTGAKWANLGDILRATWKNWPAPSIRQPEMLLRTAY